MKKLNLRDVYKRLLSLGTALVLMHTPVMANAEGTKENNTTNETEFTLVMQEKNLKPLTMVDYVAGVAHSYSYLSKYINYNDMQADLQNLYYLVNREYMPVDTDGVNTVEQKLIEQGAIYETNISEQKYEAFMRANNLFNVIADYNQSVIRKTDNIDDLIDVSELCYSETDKELVHDMHVNYFNAYKSGRFYNEDYQKVFKQLTTLNAYEHAGNADELSVGARWLAQKSIGGGVMQMLRDDMREDFSRSELDKYFDRAELNKEQWILREDVALDLDQCYEENSLEWEVNDFGQLWHFIYDTVNNDILKAFKVDCTKRK